ncbi:hypothetical protein K493DRAFT_306301 [Basidiobolus meristosporus CBS 931.73]|uniref:Uncharacterized protein n=1 Tax=Basidiobolus meristosporus CBS 931.73 TaxID=1314790 RepID=A0A1Y1XSS8_9FUNG|nr:hypothetical protein K493DRAFT_306301 [Basidiobolus meristosporus CBS 931.73]|eukprot:ORX88819.1 hypothetical protein K493DRAFT_306301 [Basidiobolus meristosporus CBS 931.73]
MYSLPYDIIPNTSPWCGPPLQYSWREALLVLILGANGEAGIFQGLAEHHYTVVTYDQRRSFAYPASMTTTDPTAVTNSKYRIKRETHQYSSVNLDLVMLSKRSEKFVLACGHDFPVKMIYAVSEALSKSLDKEILEFPESHLGCVQ